MSEIADLSARRWEVANGPDAHKPVDALREAIRQIEAGEMKADHVIICFGGETDTHVITDWLQAGTFNSHAQSGLLERVKLGMAFAAMKG